MPDMNSDLIKRIEAKTKARLDEKQVKPVPEVKPPKPPVAVTPKSRSLRFAELLSAGGTIGEVGCSKHEFTSWLRRSVRRLFGRQLD